MCMYMYMYVCVCAYVYAHEDLNEALSRALEGLTGLGNFRCGDAAPGRGGLGAGGTMASPGPFYQRPAWSAWESAAPVGLSKVFNIRNVSKEIYVYTHLHIYICTRILLHHVYACVYVCIHPTKDTGGMLLLPEHSFL